MKFNWRANWEILLVLVIIVVGIVITTIAAIRNKEKHLLALGDDADFGQTLFGSPGFTEGQDGRLGDNGQSLRPQSDQSINMIGQANGDESRSTRRPQQSPTRGSGQQTKSSASSLKGNNLVSGGHQPYRNSVGSGAKNLEDSIEFGRLPMQSQIAEHKSPLDSPISGAGHQSIASEPHQTNIRLQDSYDAMSTEPTPTTQSIGSEFGTYGGSGVGGGGSRSGISIGNTNSQQNQLTGANNAQRLNSGSLHHIQHQGSRNEIRSYGSSLASNNRPTPSISTRSYQRLGDNNSQILFNNDQSQMDLMINDIHTTRSSLANGEQATSGSLGELDSDSLGVPPQTMSLSLHAPYGVTPSSFSVKGRQIHSGHPLSQQRFLNQNNAASKADTLSDSEDMMTSYSKMPSSSSVAGNMSDSMLRDFEINNNNPNSSVVMNHQSNQYQQSGISSAMLANLLGSGSTGSELSGLIQEPLNQSNQPQLSNSAHSSLSSHLRTYVSPLPISVLLGDLMKLARPQQLINSVGQTNDGRSQYSILQQLRSLPTPFLSLFQGSGSGTGGLLSSNNHDSMNLAGSGHDASESSQHYQRLSMSPTDINSILARSMRSSGVLPAFPAPKGVQQNWPSPTSGGDPNYHSPQNANADFVAGNVAGFIRSQQQQQQSGQQASSDQQPQQFGAQDLGSFQHPADSQGEQNSHQTTSSQNVKNPQIAQKQDPNNVATQHQIQNGNNFRSGINTNQNGQNSPNEQVAAGSSYDQTNLIQQLYPPLPPGLNKQGSVINNFIGNNNGPSGQGHSQVSNHVAMSSMRQPTPSFNTQLGFASHSPSDTSLFMASSNQQPSMMVSQQAIGQKPQVVGGGPAKLPASSPSAQQSQQAPMLVKGSPVNQGRARPSSRRRRSIESENSVEMGQDGGETLHREDRKPFRTKRVQDRFEVGANFRSGNQFDDAASGPALAHNQVKESHSSSNDDDDESQLISVVRPDGRPIKKGDQKRMVILSAGRARHQEPIDMAGSGLVSKLLGTASSNSEDVDDELDDDDESANEKRKEELEDAEFGMVNDERSRNAGGGSSDGHGQHSNENDHTGSGQRGSNEFSGNNNGDSSLGSGSNGNEAYARRNQQRSDIEFYGHPGEETRQLKYGILGSGNYEVVNGGVYPEADESTAAVNSVANYVRKPSLLSGPLKLLSGAGAEHQLSGGPVSSGAGEGGDGFMPGGRMVGAFMRGASATHAADELMAGLLRPSLGVGGEPSGAAGDGLTEPGTHRAKDLSSSLLELIDVNGGLGGAMAVNDGEKLDENGLLGTGLLGGSGSSTKTLHASREPEVEEMKQEMRDPSRRQRNRHSALLDTQNHDQPSDEPDQIHHKSERYHMKKLSGSKENHNNEDKANPSPTDSFDDQEEMDESDRKLVGKRQRGDSFQIRQSMSGARKSSGSNQFNSYQILPSKKVTIFSDQDLDSASSDQRLQAVSQLAL